jgi:hypothetical protein
MPERRTTPLPAIYSQALDLHRTQTAAFLKLPGGKPVYRAMTTARQAKKVRSPLQSRPISLATIAAITLRCRSGITGRQMLSRLMDLPPDTGGSGDGCSGGTVSWRAATAASAASAHRGIASSWLGSWTTSSPSPPVDDNETGSPGSSAGRGASCRASAAFCRTSASEAFPFLRPGPLRVAATSLRSLAMIPASRSNLGTWDGRPPSPAVVASLPEAGSDPGTISLNPRRRTGALDLSTTFVSAE